MAKMHTREKRNKGLTSGMSHRTSPVKHIGPKTFKTEESAHAWAKEQGLSKDKYELVPAKKNKKFLVKKI